MFNPHWTPRTRPFAILGAAFLIAACSAHAQSNSISVRSAEEAASSGSSALAGPTESSSSEFRPAGEDAAAPDPKPADGAGAGAGQNEPTRHGVFGHMTFEAGGGFNAPTSDSSTYITWGGNFTGGSGFRFNRRISALVEYQFIDDKLPGAIIAETGANGGDAHIWSFTADPVVDLAPKRNNDLYLTGGGGFYRKVTSFTDPEPAEYCTFIYCGIAYENAVVGHFSSNQGGWSIGGGFTHRMGGIYGEGKTRLFAEVRYLDIMTPAVTTEPNGLGETRVAAGTKLLPVTLGVRF